MEFVLACYLQQFLIGSEEDVMKKLGELMNESHASCSLLYECRFVDLSINDFDFQYSVYFLMPPFIGELFY